MSFSLNKVEKSLGDIYKNAPKMPENGKKTLVEWMPWLSVIVGVLVLWQAYSVWNWANAVNKITDYANSFYSALGQSEIIKDRLTIVVWLGVIALIVQGVLYVAAHKGLKARKKAGWNLVFYAALVNVVYALVMLFSDYSGVGNFIGFLLGSAIGFYFLFQIRESYK